MYLVRDITNSALLSDTNEVLNRAIRSPEGEKIVEVDYPLAFANAFIEKLPHSRKAFRFVYLSGMLAVTDQSESVLFLEDLRKSEV